MKLGQAAFKDCTALKTTGLAPNAHVTQMGASLFQGCTALTSTGLEGNKKIASISAFAFEGCVSLKTTGLERNTTVSAIEKMAFSSCDSLLTTGISRDSAVSSIGELAFSFCDALYSTGLEASTSIASIGAYAFYDCGAFGGKATADANVGDLVLRGRAGKITIGAHAFRGTVFQRVYLDRDLKAATIGKGAFDMANGSKIPIMYVTAGSPWSAMDSFSFGDSGHPTVYSKKDGSLAVMDMPVHGVSAARLSGTSDQATATFAADRGFWARLTCGEGRDLGVFEAKRSADGSYAILIPAGAGLPLAKVNLDAAVSASKDGDAQFAFPAGAGPRFYNKVPGATLSCDLPALGYLIRFDGNGATEGSMADERMDYDVEATLTMNAFSRSGYVFSGWDAPAGERYDNGQRVRNLASVQDAVIELRARWESTASLDLTVRSTELARDGSAGAPLANAGYALSSSPDAKDEIYTVYTDSEKRFPVESWPQMSGEDGELKLYGVRPGTYHILNLTAPAGYQISQDSHWFQVDDDGVVTLDGRPYTPKDGIVKVGLGFVKAPAMPGTGVLADIPLQATGVLAVAVSGVFLGARLHFRRCAS